MSRLHASDPFRSVVVSISATDKGLVDYLKAIWGGRIIVRQKRGKDHYKQPLVWVTENRNAILILYGIRSHLVTKTKRARAAIVLEKYDAVTLRNGKYNPEQRQRKLDFEREFFSF